MKNIKGKLGFGCMRLPYIQDKIDIEQTKKMVDIFLEEGFNYFDTAHGYLDEQSEYIVKECLTSRYSRDKYILATKLSPNYFEKNEDIRPFFNLQLEALGVTYIDYYLMHCQNKELFKKYRECKAYEEAFKLKEEGKIKYVGFSFHDKADVLDEIITTYPQIDFVQIQLNYLDYEDINVEGRKCLEVCIKHNKPVIVMEPVKGGSLARLPLKAKVMLDKLYNGSPASYAIRFAASCPNVFMVLSGMSNYEQMMDNISFMKDFKPITRVENEVINRVIEIIKEVDVIPCTACKYCLDVCPMNIKIPEIFTNINNYRRYNEYDEKQINDIEISCIKCGKCEKACPQHINIRDLLDEAKVIFNK